MPLTVGDFLLGPLIALMVIGVLIGVLRWIFGHASATCVPLIGEDYGLLCAVAVADDEDTAASIKTLLGEAGIRATLATGADGRTRVLVFEQELDRARRVMG